MTGLHKVMKDSGIITHEGAASESISIFYSDV